MARQVSASAIFCDDIREEKTGKFTLVGVNPGETHLDADSDEVAIAIWLTIYGLEKGNHEFSVITRSRSGGQADELSRGRVVLELQVSGAPVSFPSPPFIIRPTGKSEIEVSLEGLTENAIEAGRMWVVKLNNPNHD
jgi:hypothetical protein